MCGRIKAICVSSKKGVPKRTVTNVVIKTNYGIVGDAHAGEGNRQISLLAEVPKFQPGDFGENFTVENINFKGASPADRIILNDKVVLEITQIGKKCDTRCRIYQELGECSISTEGIFAKVLAGGEVKTGDSVEIKNKKGV